MIIAASLACVAGSVAPRAEAFECTTTDKNDFVSIRWLRMPVTFAIQSVQTTVPLSLAETAVRRAFAAWASPRCTHIEFDDRGTVAMTTPLNEVNQVIFVQTDWTHDRDAVGLTTMTYSTIDGTISHGKIEINEALFVFNDAEVDCGARSEQYDLEAVLTHEVGHFLGIAHVLPSSGVAMDGPNAATMSPRVVECDASFRSLETDDQDGLCFIYPVGQRARGCDSLPEQTTDYVTNVPFSCAASRTGESGWWFVVILSLVLARRRVIRGAGLR